MKRDVLVRYLDDRLGIAAMDDISVNGLQVQGRDEVEKVALVTDAALALFNRAKDEDCDMIIAHHGIIWGGIKSITGRVYDQIKALMDNNINLYAAHLPLDAHPELGNNARLAKMVDLEEISPFGRYHGVAIGVSGRLPAPLAPEALAKKWQLAVGGNPVVLPFGNNPITTVGIVSGGGSGALEEAIGSGIDCFVTGEGRHENHHTALEAGINIILLGHYHSETLGVQAVGKELETRFGLETIFIDEPTIL